MATAHATSRPDSVPPASGPTKEARRGRHIAQVAASTSVLFLLAILVMVNYLASRHYQRFDWTEEGLFTLSSKSEKVLAGLDSDVEVYLFLSMGEPSFMEIKELLERYRAHSQRITVRHVDPDREPSEFRMLAQRFGLGVGVLETGQLAADTAAVVTSGERKWTIGRDDFTDFDVGSLDTGKPQLDVKAEQALTGAILQVTQGEPTKICVTKGHGEWSLQEHSERSLEGLEQNLQHDNVALEAFETLGQDAVPEGCNAVYVVGPTRAFSEAEVKLLERYVRGGGNLLLALDPVIEHDRIYPTGFEPLAEQLGFRIDGSLVIETDPQHLVSQNVVEFRAMRFDERHPTTELLAKLGGGVFMQLSRSLRIDDEGRATALVRTSDDAFAETDISAIEGGLAPEKTEEDVSGPVAVAVAATLPGDQGEAEGGDAAAKPGRVIVVGDSDWLAAPLLDSPVLANRELLSAWTGWLTEREALISIPPKRASLGYINFDQEALGGLFFRVVVLIPLAALLIGLAVWWSRRS